MRLRNYKYLSKHKIELYESQLGRRSAAQTRVAGTATAGPIHAEVERTYTASQNDHNRLEKILRSLRRRRQIGTLAKPRDFVECEVTARAISFNDLVLFGGYAQVKTEKVEVMLTCSLQNMVGHILDGSKVEKYRTSSDSLGFSRMISNVCQAEHNFQDAQYIAERELAHRQARFDERWQPTSTGDRRLDIMWDFRKKHYLLSDEDKSDIRDGSLLQDRLELLANIQNVSRQISSPYERYDCVFTMLIDERIGGKRVILGSPLYLATLHG